MSSSSSSYTKKTNEIEKIDSKVVDLVFGYIRNAESSLFRKHIPMEIALICLSYYYFDDNEYFANAGSDYCIVNSENEISIELLEENPGSAFGNVLIASQFGGVYVWTFKIMNVGYASVVCIGVSTEYEDTSPWFYENRKGHNYSLDDAGCFEKNGKIVFERNDGYGFCKDDIVIMTLNLNQRTSKYKCEGADKVMRNDEGFDDISCGLDINYKMAVFCYKTTDKLELIDFCIKD